MGLAPYEEEFSGEHLQPASQETLDELHGKATLLAQKALPMATLEAAFQNGVDGFVPHLATFALLRVRRYEQSFSANEHGDIAHTPYASVSVHVPRSEVVDYEYAIDEHGDILSFSNFGHDNSDSMCVNDEGLASWIEALGGIRLDGGNRYPGLLQIIDRTVEEKGAITLARKALHNVTRPDTPEPDRIRAFTYERSRTPFALVSLPKSSLVVSRTVAGLGIEDHSLIICHDGETEYWYDASGKFNATPNPDEPTDHGERCQRTRKLRQLQRQMGLAWASQEQAERVNGLVSGMWPHLKSLRKQ